MSAKASSQKSKKKEKSSKKSSKKTKKSKEKDSSSKSSSSSKRDNKKEEARRKRESEKRRKQKADEEERIKLQANEALRPVLDAAEVSRLGEVRGLLADNRSSELLLMRKGARGLRRNRLPPSILSFSGPDEAARVGEVLRNRLPGGKGERRRDNGNGGDSAASASASASSSSSSSAVSRPAGGTWPQNDTQRELMRLEAALFASLQPGNSGNFDADREDLSSLFVSPPPVLDDEDDAAAADDSWDSPDEEPGFVHHGEEFEFHGADGLSEYVAPPKWSMGDLASGSVRAQRTFAGSSERASRGLLGTDGAAAAPDPDQREQDDLELKRWEYLVRSRFKRGNVRDVMNKALGIEDGQVGVTDRSAAVMAGVAKLFVADLTQGALATMEDWGDGTAANGDPLQPGHVREAYRREINAGKVPFLPRKKRRLR
jgi:hTAFII28-like protein conserved region